LKSVTDGDRTFWHWESTFEPPRGREAEFAQLVGQGVYETGFEALRTHLRRGARPAGPSPARGAAMATRAVLVDRFGGPEVLRLADVEAPAPGPDEIRLRHVAIGVNYIDVYVRAGQYRLIQPPAAPGMEAAGVVLDVGDRVAHLLPGDRVAYATTPPGAYVGVRTMAAEQVVRLPDGVDEETAAALMLKGMSAAFLLHRTHAVKVGDRVLVHAAAGGVGLLLCQWARALGATVIGTVSTEGKARLARANGCAHTIVTRDHRFADAVKAATDGRGADVVYDGLGRAAAAENHDALAPLGHWVSFGQASGPLEPVAAERLGEKSLTFSRPVLFHHTARRADLLALAERTFDALARGVIRPTIGGRWPLASAADVHRALEGRGTTGSLILVP
jgi:NADPH:quinone reductase-like Zn-dependent oxidoreductase